MDQTKEEMLKDIGADGIDELFSDIPKDLKLTNDLEIPKLSEMEVKRHIKSLLFKNSPYTRSISFLGGGTWPHHVPSHIREIVRRSEFLTSYTPYQAEASQGMLQALFEYQSLISELTGLAAANSSLYDWASALGEAALMSARLTDRKNVIVPEFISPDRLSVLKSYAWGPGLNIKKVSQDRKTGQISISDLEEKVDENTACVYLENPNYFGHLEPQSEKIAEISKDNNALFVVGVNPISLGILKPPGEYGADIVVGEGQPLGNPVNFGGPSLGIFACRDERKFLRQIPGRLVGMTETEKDNTRGFTMTLQTREQHIRRKKATSNICTNQTLNALAAAVYLSSLGSSGLREVAEKCAKNAKYLMNKINELNGVSAPRFDAPHFNEFLVSFEDSAKSVEEINRELLNRGIHGGKPVQKDFPEFSDSSLWCTTELHDKEEIDWLITSLEDILGDEID